MPRLIPLFFVAFSIWAQSVAPANGNSMMQQARELNAKGGLAAAEPLYRELSQMTDNWSIEMSGIMGLFDI